MNDSEWVSLRKAAEILGVHPATVRNWADSGDLPSRRTPGKHRRFHKSDLAKLARSKEEYEPMEVQVIIQNALGQARMQIGDGNLNNVPWYAAMSEKTRDAMRHLGRELLEKLRSYMATGATDDKLVDAINMGKIYAEHLTSDGLTLPQAMRGFYYFSDFIVNSILTWSEITPPRSAPEWANLLRHVNTFMNAMQLSIIEYYEEE